MRQAIIWTNADPIHWRIYAALGWDELSQVTATHLKIEALANANMQHTSQW